MQPVRLNERKKRPRALILAGLLLVALAAAGGILLLRFSQPAKDDAQTAAEETPDMTVTDISESTISALTVWPSVGESYRLLQTEDGIHLDGRPDHPLKEQTVRNLFYTSAHIQADEKLPARHGADADGYGLDTPLCRVRVELQDGSGYDILIGGQAPTSQTRYYLKVGDQLCTVTGDVTDALNVPFTSLHPVTQPAISGEFIDRITLTGDVTFDAVREGDYWTLREPWRYPLDQSAMEGLLSALDKARFASWIGDASEELLEQTGLSAPRRTLTLCFAPTTLTVPDESGETHVFDLPESTIEIAMGNAFSATADYYLTGGEVLTGTMLSFSFLRSFDPERYLAAYPMDIRSNDLSRVTVTAKGRSSTLSVRYVERVLPNNELETDEYGNVLYDMQIKNSEGAVIDSSAFAGWYEQLMGFSTAQRLKEPFIPREGDEPSLVIEVSGADGLTRSLAFYPYDALRDRLAVSGVALYLCDSDRGRRLLEGFEALSPR